MIAKHLEEIRERLLERKSELEAKLDLMAKAQVSDGQVQDPGDQALSSTMESLLASLQDTDLGQYKRVIRALTKIDEGSYGVCIDCGNDISEKRLESFPDAARCLVCQEEFEDSNNSLLS